MRVFNENPHLSNVFWVLTSSFELAVVVVVVVVLLFHTQTVDLAAAYGSTRLEPL